MGCKICSIAAFINMGPWTVYKPLLQGIQKSSKLAHLWCTSVPKISTLAQQCPIIYVNSDATTIVCPHGKNSDRGASQALIQNWHCSSIIKCCIWYKRQSQYNSNVENMCPSGFEQGCFAPSNLLSEVCKDFLSGKIFWEQASKDWITRSRFWTHQIPKNTCPSFKCLPRHTNPKIV